MNASGTFPPALAVDRANSVIRGVSVITGGVQAKGHDLWTDHVTLEQIAECGRRMGKVLVKENHRRGGESTGVDAAVGWLQDFRVEGEHTRADLHLYPSHPKRDLYLDIAERTPELMGLSAAFVPSTKSAVVGDKECARVEELVTVDIVAQPAANPGGWFEAQRPHQTGATEGVQEYARRRLRELSAKVRQARDEREDGRAIRVAAASAGGLAGAVAGLRSARGRKLAPGEMPKAGDVVERDVFRGTASHRGVVLPSGRVVHAKRGAGENPVWGTAQVATDTMTNFRPSRVHRPAISPPIRNPNTSSGPMHYNPISANSDQKLRAATGARFPDQVRRALAGAAVGGVAGYVAARAAQRLRREDAERRFSAIESTAAAAISQRDREDLVRRLKVARERAARRQQVKAVISGGTLGAATGAILAPNALRGARVGAATGAAVGAIWPRLFESQNPRTELPHHQLSGAWGTPAQQRANIASLQSVMAALRHARTKRPLLKFAVAALPGAPGPGNTFARLTSALLRSRLGRYAAAGAAGVVAGQVLGGRRDERERPGILRRVAQTAGGAYIGARLIGPLIKRYAPVGSVVGRNPGLAGGILGGLGGLALARRQYGRVVALDVAGSALADLPSDVIDGLESIVRANVMAHSSQYASHSLQSLAKRLPLRPEEILAIVTSGQLRPIEGRQYSGDLAVFDTRDIEALRSGLIEAEIERVVRVHRNDPAVQRDPRALVPIVRVAIEAFLRPKTP